MQLGIILSTVLVGVSLQRSTVSSFVAGWIFSTRHGFNPAKWALIFIIQPLLAGKT